MCKEVRVSSENALLRLSAPFWAAFAGRLVSVFGVDIFQPEDSSGHTRGVDYVTGTYGWRLALKATCEELGDDWFFDWYDSLDWMKSDEFDCDIVVELKNRMLDDNRESNHTYYEWLDSEDVESVSVGETR